MSGIAGVIGGNTDSNVAEKMLATMCRRGPDGNGVWTEPECCFLYARRASPEEGVGIQPLQLLWGEDQCTIVFDGNLFNGKEIRCELIKCGHVFKTDDNSETMIHAYVEWREKALDKINGVFSFAIWHHKERKLFIARDRIGVKPLFYFRKEWGMSFATEIKTLLAHPETTARINAIGIAQLLLLGPGRISGSGVFADVSELQPGCYGVYCNGTLRIDRYWKLTDREHTENFEDTIAHVRYLVLDSINRQMPKTLPVGAFLSGGLDSSIISSVCSKITRNSGSTLKTFSVDYIDQEQNFTANRFQPESDHKYIRMMCNSIQCDHSDIILSSDELAACIEQATQARGLPGMGDVDFSLFAFTKQVRNFVPVAFSGECADEIFGGYPWYRDPELRDTDGFPWSQNLQFRSSFVRSELLRDIDPKSFVMDLYLDTINHCDILPGTPQTDRRIKELTNLNFEWFMQTLLDRNDRMSMYHGLDVRVPFCDYRIAEYLYGVPWVFKNYGEREKGLLRLAMKDYLPEQVLYRKKSPYPKTFDPRYLEIVSKKLSEVIANPKSPLLQIVRKESLENLTSAEFSWPWYGQLMRLPQTIAYMLQINCWLELYNVDII